MVIVCSSIIALTFFFFKFSATQVPRGLVCIHTKILKQNLVVHAETIALVKREVKRRIIPVIN